MELTSTAPNHCFLQVLLVSPPQPPPHHPHNIEPEQSKNQSRTKTKPFSPWKPGDAYSVEQDLSDWRLLLGSIDEGDQTRRWDHKDKRWYYHSKDKVTTQESGTTGGLVVVFLIILLTLYSLRRLWIVWAEILNFDGILQLLFQTSSPRGWDFLVQWVLHIIKIKRRKRRKRHKKRRNNNNNHPDHQTTPENTVIDQTPPRENGHFFQEESSSSVVINFENSRLDIPVSHQVIQSQDITYCSSFATLV